MGIRENWAVEKYSPGAWAAFAVLGGAVFGIVAAINLSRDKTGFGLLFAVIGIVGFVACAVQAVRARNRARPDSRA